MPVYPASYTNDHATIRIFSWQTRIGLAPKFGSVNISQYQNQQVAIIDAIERLILSVTYSGEPANVTMHKGRLIARFRTDFAVDIGSIETVYANSVHV